MKKLIAAALAILLSATGYTIVDKTVEKRVADLEYSVSSLVEENNSLHCIKEYSTKFSQIATVYVELPNAGKNAEIKCTLNNNDILNKQINLDGSMYTVFVEGTETDEEFCFFIDDVLYYECSVDFTQTPCKISNQKTFSIFCK